MEVICLVILFWVIFLGFPILHQPYIIYYWLCRWFQFEIPGNFGNSPLYWWFLFVTPKIPQQKSSWSGWVNMMPKWTESHVNHRVATLLKGLVLKRNLIVSHLPGIYWVTWQFPQIPWIPKHVVLFKGIGFFLMCLESSFWPWLVLDIPDFEDFPDANGKLRWPQSEHWLHWWWDTTSCQGFKQFGILPA